MSYSKNTNESSKQWLLSNSVMMTVLANGTLSKLCNILIALLIKHFTEPISVESVDPGSRSLPQRCAEFSLSQVAESKDDLLPRIDENASPRHVMLLSSRKDEESKPSAEEGTVFRISKILAPTAAAAAAEGDIPADMIEDERICCDNILDYINSIRSAEYEMLQELHSIGSEDAIENYLMKRFLVERLPTGVLQRLGYMIIMSGGTACRDDWAESARKRFILLPPCLFVYLSLVIVFILMISAATNPWYLGLWLKAFAISLVQDIFVVKPAVVLMHFLFIRAFLVKRIGSAVNILKERFESVSHSDNMLAQHYSAVCRAAGVAPNLNIAQMLIALNDEDILACEGHIQTMSSASALWERLSNNVKRHKSSGFRQKIFAPVSLFKFAEMIVVLIIDVFIIVAEWSLRK